MTAKAEALRTSDAVAEHFRNRAITAECDVTRLLGLQLDALAASEDAQARLTNQRNEISRFVIAIYELISSACFSASVTPVSGSRRSVRVSPRN